MNSNPLRDSRPANPLLGLSPIDFARFGLEEVAYFRPIVLNGVRAVAIHAADGTQIGAAPSTDLAIAAIIEHEMAPVALH